MCPSKTRELDLSTHPVKGRNQTLQRAVCCKESVSASRDLHFLLRGAIHETP